MKHSKEFCRFRLLNSEIGNDPNLELKVIKSIGEFSSP